jgi:hypothetical protein
MLIRVNKGCIFVPKYGRVIDMLSLTQSLLGGFVCLVPGSGVINFEDHTSFFFYFTFLQATKTVRESRGTAVLCFRPRY